VAQVGVHLLEQQPRAGQAVEFADAGELVEVDVPSTHRAGHVGVEQLGHVPSERTCSNATFPASSNPGGRARFER
jgi:hypothetical protein